MLIADLHIHSKYSRATSRDGVPEVLDLWARRKGIHLVGTGDFTHPAWRGELREKLEPAEEGLYRLKASLRQPDAPAGVDPRFLVTGEISCIYKKNGKVRKVHNVILLPSLEAAEELSHRLEAIGNLHSDGRPILGLDSRDLLEITLDCCPQGVLIPAHIWTPHFSLFGAFSGFDTLEECFGDLSGEIHALETGLSSDPPMNWQVSALDGYTLVSNSDAHSPAKLGREANLLNTGLSYGEITDAIQGRNPEGFYGTIEFFPEEGKYHYDGHRNCHVCLTPQQCEALDGRCPVCGKKLTIGVQHRVDQLSDRQEGYRPANARPFERLVPLPEVIGASTGHTATSKRVQQQYETMLRLLGPEFEILRTVPLDEIGQVAGPCVQEGIRRLRCGQVQRQPGFDGEYGVIRLLSPQEIQELSGQVSLFGAAAPLPLGQKAPRASSRRACTPAAKLDQPAPQGADLLQELNEEQRSATTAPQGVLAVVAGPGTGKTKTLISRIVHLLQQGAKPSEITAVTFTNRAAQEMRERLEQQCGKRQARAMTIGTFHAICLQRMQKQGQDCHLLSREVSLDLARQALDQVCADLAPDMFLQELSRRKNGLSPETELPQSAIEAYAFLCRQGSWVDFDDLLLAELHRCQENGKRERCFTHLLVDEFQDINPVQYQLVLQWAAKGRDLFVIGDADQAIYGFRGASADCFERLQEHFPQMKQIRLVKNYRSTPQVVESALPIINRNPGPARSLQAQRPSGAPVRLIRAESERSAGIFVAKEINRMVGGVDMLDAQHLSETDRTLRSFSEIAILYRTHRQARRLEQCLRQEGIPYVVVGREQALQDPGVQGTLAFWFFFLHPQAFCQLSRALELLWSVPRDLIQSLVSQLQEGAYSTSEAQLLYLKGAYDQVGVLQEPLRLWEEYLPRLPKEKPYRLLEDWACSIHRQGQEPMEKLIQRAVFHPKAEQLLENLLLGQEGDLTRSSSKSYSSGAVTLMTLHGSKGLEFPVVFLCGVEKDLIPYESKEHPTDPQEERRLFFVGMTRAKEELILMTGPEPSEFLQDLPPEHLVREQALLPREPVQGTQLSLFDHL